MTWAGPAGVLRLLAAGSRMIPLGDNAAIWRELADEQARCHAQATGKDRGAATDTPAKAGSLGHAASSSGARHSLMGRRDGDA